MLPYFCLAWLSGFSLSCSHTSDLGYRRLPSPLKSFNCCPLLFKLCLEEIAYRRGRKSNKRGRMAFKEITGDPGPSKLLSLSLQFHIYLLLQSGLQLSLLWVFVSSPFFFVALSWYLADGYLQSIVWCRHPLTVFLSLPCPFLLLWYFPLKFDWFLFPYSTVLYVYAFLFPVVVAA